MNFIRIKSILIFLLMVPSILSANVLYSEDEGGYDNNYVTSFNIGRSNFYGDMNDSGYGNSFGFGLGVEVVDDLFLGLDYTDLNATSYNGKQLNYIGSSLWYDYPVNSLVDVTVGVGLGYSLSDSFSENSDSNYLFPSLNLGFNYQLSERWYIGVGYKTLFNVSKNNDSVNNIYLAFKLKFNSSNANKDRYLDGGSGNEIEPMTTLDENDGLYFNRTNEVGSLVEKNILYYFNLEEYKLSVSDETNLVETIVESNKERNVKKVIVTVNTDGSGSDKFNSKLSSRRGKYAREIIEKTVSTNGELIIKEKVNKNSPLFYQCFELESKKEKAACLEQDRALEVILYSEM